MLNLRKKLLMGNVKFNKETNHFRDLLRDLINQQLTFQT